MLLIKEGVKLVYREDRVDISFVKALEPSCFATHYGRGPSLFLQCKPDRIPMGSVQTLVLLANTQFSISGHILPLSS